MPNIEYPPMARIRNLTNEELVEDFKTFTEVCNENPEDVGSSSELYDLEQELLRRLNRE